MPSAKSGSAGSPVSPSDPEKALAADKADPGEMAKVKALQQETQKGKYGSTPFKAHKPDKTKKGWIEVSMLYESNSKPVPGLRFEVKLPDGTVAGGSLDEKGCGRVEGFDSGSCEVSFPDLDKDAWTDA